MKTELKEIKSGIYKLVINGKQSGKPFRGGTDTDAEGNKIALNDKLFDIPCNALPDNITFRFFINPDDPNEWLHITSLTRKKNKLIIAYFASMTQNGNDYLNLNPYVLIMKIADIAKKAGIQPDYVSQDEANTTLFLVENTTGSLRQKITKGRTIITGARTKAEQKLVAAVKKGILVSKIKSTDFKGYLDLPW